MNVINDLKLFWQFWKHDFSVKMIFDRFEFSSFSFCQIFCKVLHHYHKQGESEKSKFNPFFSSLSEVLGQI